MDASSVVSSLSVPRSHEFGLRSPVTGRDMVVQKRWSGSGSREVAGGSGGHAGSRRLSSDGYQRSEISGTGTDLSAERPSTRDTSAYLMRDATTLSGCTLSGKPDKSDFREKLQSWTVLEHDTGSPYMAPRPTTSLASQKPSAMTDIEREMSFLLSRPSTSSFPVKPKELVEPLEGLMPEERPVSQKKFLVLPSIGAMGRFPHQTDLFIRRQRSNLETINQLDYSRELLEQDAQFFSDYYQPQFAGLHVRSPSVDNLHRRAVNSRAQSRSTQHTQCTQQQAFSDDESLASPTPAFNARDTPTKQATPMPLPPIHKIKWDKLRTAGLAGLEEANENNPYSSRLTSHHTTHRSHHNTHRSHTYRAQSYDDNGDDDDDDDLEQFRLKTPETCRSDSPVYGRPFITPPPAFR